MKTMPDDKAGSVIRGRYNRFAPFYDFLEGMGERTIGAWRKILWSKVAGEHILEVGVGTGRNLPFYPGGKKITALDFSERMLARAHEKVGKTGTNVSLLLMDGHHLGFRDNTFDTVVTSLVFCSVPDPVRGLQEIARVVKPGGQVLLLEHVISDKRVAAWLMNRMNPLMLSLFGDNINRRTAENVAKSGLVVEKVTHLSSIFRLIEARKGVRLGEQ